MCGIAGILSPAGANPGAVQAMTDIQAYRGPDGEGHWTSSDGRCAFGHRRLAIIDLSEGGHQPMVDVERGLSITYNGEIYNFVELRDRLLGLGHTFRTESDTEVLLSAYAHWGTECLAELNGMFAFAIWDARREVLFCARDRFGEKPFLYAFAAGAFAFASEAKAVALVREVDLSIDAGVLAAFIEDGHTRIDGGERTLFRGVRQLLPAHAMEVRVAGDRTEILRTWCYWSVDVDGRERYGTVDPDRAGSELRELMTDSVRLRLRSDVPVGSCLSGGLDSSSLVCLMRQLEPGVDLRTFTGRFPGDAMDEGHYAAMVVEQCQTNAFEVAPSPERFAAEADQVYWHADFPIGGTSQFAQWCVFHLASQNGVTVLLDGQGSDELLGGYGNAITAAFLKQLWAQRERRAWFRERAASARSNPNMFSWPRLLLNRPELGSVRDTLRRHTGRSQVTRETLFQPDWFRSARLEREALWSEELRGDESALSSILWTLSFRTMLSSLLRYGDRLSMAHSREVRLPFCDHRIAEFAFGVPPELLLGDGDVKRVLRLAIRGLVPEGIVTRPKQGFIPPQNGWLIGPLHDLIIDLASDPGPIGELLDRTFVVDLANADSDTRQREAVSLWDMTNLLAWSHFAAKRMQAACRLPASGSELGANG